MPDFATLPLWQKALYIVAGILVLIAGGYIRSWIDRHRRP